MYLKIVEMINSKCRSNKLVTSKTIFRVVFTITQQIIVDMIQDLF